MKVAHALSYGEGVNQAGLEEAWSCLENDDVVPDGVTLEDFLYADSCVVPIEEGTDDSIMEDLFGNSHGNPCSYTNAEGAARNNLKVLATRDRLGHKMLCNPYGAMNIVGGHL